MSDKSSSWYQSPEGIAEQKKYTADDKQKKGFYVPQKLKPKTFHEILEQT